MQSFKRHNYYITKIKSDRITVIAYFEIEKRFVTQFEIPDDYLLKIMAFNRFRTLSCKVYT